jgi:hypothetical protein
VEERFSWKHIAEETVGYYGELAGRRGPVRGKK